MKTHEAARIVGIHVNTVRTWTMAPDFKPFFSLNAQGGSGSTRSLTDDDVRLLAHINRLKSDGMLPDEIVMALRDVQKRGVDSLPYPAMPSATASLPVVSREAADSAVSAERKIMAEHVHFLEARIDELKDELAMSQAERETLLRKLITAETELRMYKEGWRPPSSTP